ncbi:hypothetical protein [Metaclostridioides mangenotii]|uniref:hypothetical protein n=1 Tax=Metaclostridioides mangenotii TaxID=1540 RepID=UPI0004B000BF|nr:hypothetical protein [Clostridioides mangenotii]
MRCILLFCQRNLLAVGRWEFKARAGRQNSWVTRPGIRASNRSGNFVVKFSQTMQLNYSSHSTGVIQISMGDR